MMGITEESLRFLEENHRRNDREWFSQHKERYKELVEAPMLALAENLGPVMLTMDPSIEIRPRKTLCRIWRDTRFSKDKTLFKRSVWITFRREKGLSHPVYFFEFSQDFHRYGCGYYETPAAVMACVREHILDGDEKFKKAQKTLKKLSHFKIEGDVYKRPQYPDQRAELREWLERKSITVMHTNSDQSLLFSEDLAGILAEAFIGLGPVYDFLAHCHAKAMKKQWHA